MKKSKFYLLSPILYLLTLIPLVHAGPVQGVEQLLTGLREVLVLIITFAMDVLLDVGQIDKYLFSKIMIFAIVLLIVYTVLKKNAIFGDKGPIIWIISSSIAILSVRFMSEDLVDMTLLQYGSLGIAITTFLPLMIFLFFLHQSDIGPFARKMGWLIYGAALASLTISRDINLGDALYIYLAAVLFVVFAFLGDTIIHGKFNKAELKAMQDIHKALRISKIGERIEGIEKAMDTANPSNRKKLEKERKRLKKYLEKI